MLDTENLSPFPHLAFTALDVDDQPWETIVARGTYRLEPVTNGTTTHALFESDAQVPLLVSDAYFGEIAASSVRAESDLAPFKPKCDVVLVASAHSPDGKPARSVEVAVRVLRRPIDFAVSEQAATGVLLEHRLVVHGERFFLRRDRVDRAAAALVGIASLGKVRAPEWHLSEAEHFVTCPIAYEHAFGGRLDIRADESAIIERLDEARKQKIASVEARAADVLVLREEYEDNPYGRGFIEPWYAMAARIEKWPAPRIETTACPLTAERFQDLVRGEQRPPLPEGFGLVAKHWPRRRTLSGTCDEAWERERCPRLPKDFDMAFWNGASPSMQCPRLYGGETIELVNLLPAEAGAIDRDSAGNAVGSFALPRAGLMLRFDGAEGAIYEPVFIDTLDVDLHEMEVSLVWRFRMPQTDGHIKARLMALGPILDEHPRLVSGVVEAAARSRSQPEKEMV